MFSTLCQVSSFQSPRANFIFCQFHVAIKLSIKGAKCLSAKRIGLIFFLISSSILSVSGEKSNLSTPNNVDMSQKLLCYTCMSDNVPEISKHLMRHTINIPDYAQSSICNDPFSFSTTSPMQNNVKLEECDTACVKIISENKYLKIVMRGCIDKLYNNEFSPSTMNARREYDDNCDLQTANNVGLGDTVTGTCLCSTNFCNGRGRLQINFALIIILCLLCIYVLNI